MLATERPSSVAQEEFMQILESARFQSGFLRDESDLRQIWEIDCQAYDHNIHYDELKTWWSGYQHGTFCLFVRRKIVASVGIYPLSQEQADQFCSGSIPESDLRPALTDGRNWYISGCVIVPEWRNRGLIRPLMRIGFGGWLTRENLPDNIKLISLGESPLGCKLLERAGFNRTKPANQMPDRSALYEIQTTPVDFSKLLKGL